MEDNIWGPFAPNASNAYRSAIYVKRAEAAITSELLHRGPSALFNGDRVARQSLAEIIGCRPCTLSENKRIRALLERTDAVLAVRHIPGEVRELHRTVKQFGRDETNVRMLHATSNASRIVYSTNELILYGKPYPGIPAIIFADGIHEWASDWLRSVRVERDLTPGTAGQYAKMLRGFLRAIRSKHHVSEVNDSILIGWRNDLASKTSKSNANSSLEIIFEFLLYCEQTSRMQYRVGCYENQELPHEIKGVHFPITAILALSNGGRSRWITPLLFRTVPSSIGNRATPDDADIQAAHRFLRNMRHERRIGTIIDLVEDSGARVSELMQLKVRDIPSEYELLAALETDDSRWEIEVIRKGGNKLKLYFSSDVLLETRFYLKFRFALIATRKTNHPDYAPPDDLFLSEKTGLGLKPGSVSKIVARLFKRIGVKRVGIHRIRAKFAIDTIDRILDEYLASGLSIDAGSAWVDTIIQQAAQLMGHRSTSSLRHYLHDALDRRLRRSRKHESLEDGGDEQKQRVQAMVGVLNEQLRREATVVQS